ncbi:MAG: hypothetical protein J4478_01505 [Candidatus Diapherotrites archaeon]|uniref:Uncharacterized protein n=1 Tax=Candidatus Iainarchaeum sp. TaxID=3101447 RepID=A0A7J4KRP2_9ARCH|nr:MAG: hypothetical protein QT12_C0022G0004 [archaeon GW2011_AR21]MBS3058058.1 hypothetical protein [Candidatus Diapherotrites archaeon]HIH21953.1 hypothetical protein [Candidatus Diapherotrites archaeon]HIH32673.1 hypothetical protein [Candidatus Diapherotrites archaeon]
MQETKLPFRTVRKISIKLSGKIGELENRKLQYDLLTTDKVLRAHIGKQGNAIIIAAEGLKAGELLRFIPKKLKPKVECEEKIPYTELLSKTYTIKR